MRKLAVTENITTDGVDAREGWFARMHDSTND